MGLFSRKKSEQTTRSTSRTTTSSEAQAAELRGRARRRLIGALVLVLTAIIVVPMLFDDTSTQQADTPLVLPAIVPPIPEPDLAAVNPPEYSVDEPVLVEGALQTGESTAADSASEAGLTTDATAPVVQQSPTDASEAGHTAGQPDVAPSQPDRASTPQPKPAAPASQTSKPKPEDRTDDGSMALALLEGRVPATTSQSAKPAQQGSFVLQVAAYSTEADAQSRRSSLIDAGVTNAYVEQAVSNNKTTYRLRVGSFPTRDAAQAAQARLRALGYDNSLLLTQ